MIITWASVFVIFILGIILIGYLVSCAREAKEDEESTRNFILGSIVTAIVTVAICAGALLWLYGTESGKRVVKDTMSNIAGGIERTVTVYDIEGDIIYQYAGKFDVDYSEDKIKFDDENGKRHIIYFTAGTLIIDEN